MPGVSHSQQLSAPMAQPVKHEADDGNWEALQCRSEAAVSPSAPLAATSAP